MARGFGAAATYKTKAKQVARLQADLAHLLAKHREKAAAKPFDYGYPGDLSYVEDRLTEIVRFLGGGEMPTYPVVNQRGETIRVTVPE